MANFIISVYELYTWTKYSCQKHIFSPLLHSWGTKNSHFLLKLRFFKIDKRAKVAYFDVDLLNRKMVGAKTLLKSRFLLILTLLKPRFHCIIVVMCARIVATAFFFFFLVLSLDGVVTTTTCLCSYTVSLGTRCWKMPSPIFIATASSWFSIDLRLLS